MALQSALNPPHLHTDAFVTDPPTAAAISLTPTDMPSTPPIRRGEAAAKDREPRITARQTTAVAERSNIVPEECLMLVPFTEILPTYYFVL